MSYLQRRKGVGWGRVCLRGTGIPMVVLIERYRAGETVEELADDYNQSISLIDLAIDEFCERYRTTSKVIQQHHAARAARQKSARDAGRL